MHDNLNRISSAYPGGAPHDSAWSGGSLPCGNPHRIPLPTHPLCSGSSPGGCVITVYCQTVGILISLVTFSYCCYVVSIL